jgi:sarcosine oxidase, subunit alpha
MKHVECIIIGGGPAGLCAAFSAASAGVHVTLFERSAQLGGQLIKQTHKFFGSERQYAKTRGFDIAKKLIADIEPYRDFIDIHLGATVVAVYPDKVVTVLEGDKYAKYQANTLIVTTGASEKVLAFENNDLPGIYGAGAVQTLMNLYGVYPGQRVVMVGSGNIGLIVSYQLLQAGVEVAAVLEAAQNIGGYKVHASKLRRLGVPIYTQTTVKRAVGTDCLTAVETTRLDENWKPVEGSETLINADALCISVGLSPLHSLLSMSGVAMKFVHELGGKVPVANEHHETSLSGMFVAGDVFGIEEASSAIVEGYLTGLYAAKQIGKLVSNHEALIADYHAQLNNLRSGPFGKKTRIGLAKLQEVGDAR